MKSTVKKRIIGIGVIFLLMLMFSGIQASAARNDDQLRDAGTLLNHFAVADGERYTINAKVSGGAEPYSYKFSYADNVSGAGKTTGYRKAPLYSMVIPADPAFYTFRVTVRDADGHTLDIERSAVVQQDTQSPLESTGSVSASRLPSGGSITASLNAAGGIAPYMYRFAYTDPAGKRTELSDDYDYVSKRTFSLPEAAGKYLVIASVKDSGGNISEKRFSVTTYPISVSKSTITKTTTFPGDKITLTSKPEYAIGNVRYHYSYHLEGRPWVFLGDYVKSPRKIFSFSYGGVFYVRVGIKDEQGRYAEKQFRINVKSMDISSSKVSADIIPAGGSVKLTSSAVNSYGQVKYHYSYHAEGKPWSFLGDYITSQNYTLRFNRRGVYYFRVGAKDESGKYQEKQFRILVYENTDKTTIRATYLMASSKWASSSVSYLPAGSRVNIILDQNNWFMVRYGSYKGWIYNLALGNYKNYSSISESSIGSIADDIIFRKGKAIKGLFDEVSQYGYKATNDFGYEKNIAYIIKYRRGACYQHTAYLDFLLSRAGYETRMVTDGQIKRKPEWTLHTWVIVKTSSGWRHIDATPVRETGCAYLKDDKWLGRYFWWDAKKYPRCI